MSIRYPKKYILHHIEDKGKNNKEFKKWEAEAGFCVEPRRYIEYSLSGYNLNMLKLLSIWQEICNSNFKTFHQGPNPDPYVLGT